MIFTKRAADAPYSARTTWIIKVAAQRLIIRAIGVKLTDVPDELGNPSIDLGLDDVKIVIVNHVTLARVPSSNLGAPTTFPNNINDKNDCVGSANGARLRDYSSSSLSED